MSKDNIFLDSSMVEHAAVNRSVVGSSPTRGATHISLVAYQAFLFTHVFLVLKLGNPGP